MPPQIEILDANGNINTEALAIGLAEVSNEVLRAEADERSQYAPKKDRVLQATDGSEVYVGDGSQWVDVSTSVGMSAPSQDVDSQSGSHSVLIDSATKLDDLDSNLSQGDVALVAQPATPYRTSSWINIDTQDVTVIFESRWAKDGQAIVKPADGADVGGIRIGTGATTIEDVEVRNFGFDGNESTMTGTVKRLHALIVDNASYVTVRDCFATQTHPYQEHNTGGSGFTVRRTASHVWLVGNRLYDIGDRGIQVSGDNILVRGNVGTDGFDRTISWNVTEPDGNSYVARNIAIVGNFGRDNRDGSIVGVGGGTSRADRGYATIMGNVGKGVHANMIQLGNTDLDNVKAITVVGNVGDGSQADSRGNGLRGQITSPDTYVAVGNNVFLNYPGKGISLVKGHAQHLVGNVIVGVGEQGIHLENGSNKLIANNLVRDTGGHGIDAGTGFSGYLVANNTVRFAGDHGIIMREGGAVIGNSVRDSNQNGSGSDEFNITSEDVLVSGNHVASRNGATTFNDASGANTNEFYGNKGPQDGSLYSVPSGAIVNGEVAESANAESPQASYPPGTFVRFTDTGDGSGTGTYLIARDGSSIQVASSA